MTSSAMLNGIRIIDLTTVVFGPYATQTLADLGAEVIKIEPPDGDIMRYAGRPASTPGMGPCHLGLNRGKQSIVLDLKTPEDKAVLGGLLRTADVFIHNVRGEAIRRLGFGYDDVRALRPDIIYVHCVGFGSDGPYADLQAYDDVIQAATGTTTLASRIDGDPRPRYIPSLIADKVAGLHGAYAALAALVHKLRTGEGQHVEVPMFEAFASFLLKEHLFGAALSPQLEPAGYPRQLDPNRQPFPTADGYISIVPYTAGSLEQLFEVLGDSDTLKTPDFATSRDRAINMTRLYQRISELTPARTTAQWMELFTRHQIPAMPVRDLADMTDDPHLQQTGFFTQRTHPTEGTFVQMAPPVRFSAMPGPQVGLAPNIDEDGAAIRAALTPGKD